MSKKVSKKQAKTKHSSKCKRKAGVSKIYITDGKFEFDANIDFIMSIPPRKADFSHTVNIIIRPPCV